MADRKNVPVIEFTSPLGDPKLEEMAQVLRAVVRRPAHDARSVRTPPATCEYITGVPYEGLHGGGQHLVYCVEAPVAGFRLLGISPLYVCQEHLRASKATFSYYAKDIVVSAL